MNAAKPKNRFERMLALYDRFKDGEIINKEKEAMTYQVNTRTIQRDIDNIRDHLSDCTVTSGEVQRIIYDKKKSGYRLEPVSISTFTNSEVFSLFKILLESRSLVKEELFPILDKLFDSCSNEKERKKLVELVRNEKFYYIEPRHGEMLMEKVWKLSGAVYEHRVLDIYYLRLDGEVTHKAVKPVGIMCSEYYFYLAGFVGDSDKKYPEYPTIYRIDRIKSFEVQKERFFVPDKNRFEEGKFRKKIPFMYGGPLTKVEFIYKGSDINAVLDRLPSAEGERMEDGSYRVIAEVYGRVGIEMWLRSQGDMVERI